MKKQKLSLHLLKVQSFVIQTRKYLNTLQGGSTVYTDASEQKPSDYTQYKMCVISAANTTLQTTDTTPDRCGVNG